MNSPSKTTGGIITLDVWGTRGSRSLIPARSAIGNRTSCYSIRDGDHLIVLDGGSGLAALGHAVVTEKRFEDVRRVTLFVSHAHMDHWEGLKDSDWFWSKTEGLELEIFGPGEALKSIEAGYGHPSFVPLQVLAENNLADIRFNELKSGMRSHIGGWELTTYPLYHYSGSGADKHYLDTLGFRLLPDQGEPVVCYLCDHEPTAATRTLEQEILTGAHLALLDAHFPDIASHAFGHGSLEQASALARAFPETFFLATHHGPSFSDREIREGFEKYSQHLSNLQLGVEGMTLRWDAERRAFIEGGLEPSGPPESPHNSKRSSETAKSGWRSER
jgi:ribonuclease BN (tRNA processing enzyme)